MLPQVMAVHNMVHVSLSLFLRQDMSWPGICQQVFFIPAVSVNFAGSVAGSIWPLIPVPNPSDAGGLLEELDRKPKLAELVELIDTGETGTDDNGIK